MSLYNNFKGLHHIDTQTFPGHLKKDGTKTLNYEPVNNNIIVHKRKLPLYDYKVQSHTDLAKLYLQTHMAKFSAFDESVDASAVLGLLCEVPSFNLGIQTTARDVRAEGRNEWGHCNFGAWDDPKFQDCFQKMEDLVKSLGLSKKDTDDIVDELNDWRTKGVKLCMGSYVDKDLITLLYHEVSILANYTLDANDDVQKELKNICDKLNELLKGFKERLQGVEAKQEKEEERLQGISETQESQDARLTSLEQKEQLHEIEQLSLGLGQANIDTTVIGVACEQTKTTAEVKELKTGHEKTDKKMKQLDAAIASCSERQNDLEDNVNLIEENVSEMKERIENVEEKLSEVTKPVISNTVFQAPNRNEYFSGREKEMAFLEAEMLRSNDGCHSAHKMIGICGLGGCGKTALAGEFSWRFRDMYPGGIFWISAENETFFRNTVNELAFELHTFHSNFDDCLRQTLASLSGLTTTWLLVVDNTDQLDLGRNVRKVLCGHWKRNSKGHVLVTTRRNSLELFETCDVKEKNCITLECLNKEDAIRFMSVRTATEFDRTVDSNSRESDSENERAKAKLADELGCLPLALEQAAAHIKALSCTFQDYLFKYRQQKLKLLQQKKARPPSEDVSRERLAVHTTWQINFNYASAMASECGLENVVSVIVNVSAFLAPDEIPFEVINPGAPTLDLEAFEDQDRHWIASQVIEILTRFSLFKSSKHKVFSVHRLVQEVIRDNCASDSNTHKVLQCAARMLNYAFSQTKTPKEVLKGSAVDNSTSTGQEPALATWKKLASHATVLKDNMLSHIQSNPETELEAELLYCKETAALMQETAIYYSMSNQQVEALESQKWLLNVIASLKSPDPSGISPLDDISLHVPLTHEQQKCLRSHLRLHEEPEENDKGSSKVDKHSMSVDELRQEGNTAFRQQRYDEAVELYTNAIELGKKQNISSELEAVLLSNRAQCHLKQGKPSQALADTSKCVKKDPTSWKGYCRRAVAMSILTKAGEEEYELPARASAAMAVHLNPKCESDPSFREYFPNGSPLFEYVTSQAEWEEALKYNQVVILKQGQYHFPKCPHEVILDDNFILIGDENVEIDKSWVLPLGGKFHFENICFDRANVVSLGSAGSAIHCIFKNGQVTLSSLDTQMKDHDPLCTGCLYCHVEMFPFDKEKLPSGNAQLQMERGGSLLVVECKIHDGAGGIFVTGDDSKATVRNCEIYNHKLAAVEVREGASLHAEGNEIHSTNWQGVCVGPKAAHCLIEDNHIHNHASFGILVQEESKEVTIQGNKVYQNGEHGIMITDHCSGCIRGNFIFENWFWGIKIQRKSNATIDKNIIHTNKCGGIRIFENYSGKVFITNNQIRDHNGPGLFSRPKENPFGINEDVLWNVADNLIDLSAKYSPEMYRQGKEKLKFYEEWKYSYTDPPVTSNNVEERNVEGQQHPKKAMMSVWTVCSYCYRTRKKEELPFGKCGKCGKVAYCAKDCQIRHWKAGHKALCQAVVEMFSVLVHVPVYDPRITRVHIFGKHLKGIKEGPKPDRRSNKRFIVKIQIPEYINRNDKCKLPLYDQSTDVDFAIENATIFHIIAQCGVLGMQKQTGKKIFCWAAFEKAGEKLRIYLDELAPFQTW